MFFGDQPTQADVLARWREDTPGCDHRIHLNNAGAGLMPSPVFKVIQTHLQNELLYGGYEAADEANEDISLSYTAIAQLIGTKSSNIAIVENATVATSQVLSAFSFQNGDIIITTRMDYSSNQIMLLNLAKRIGVNIVRADDLPEGGVDPDSVRRLIRKGRCRLVLMTWVPTNSGLVQNAQHVGEACAAEGVPFVLDACQAVGQLPIDVSSLHCDFMAATSRKFLRGPRGIGFLYVSDSMLNQGLHPLFIDTRGSKWTKMDAFRLEKGARRFENWEFPYALVLGMGTAAQYALNVQVEIAGGRAASLANYARKRLNEMEGMRILDRGSKQCAIMAIAVEGHNARWLVKRLREQKINTSPILREHALIDMDEKKVKTALRISPHYYNTFEEIDILIEAIAEICSNR